MSTARKIIPPEILLEAYRRNSGNKQATARELGIDRQTLRNNLALYGANKKPLVGGDVKPLKHNVLSLPEKGKIKRYILSSAQNNTKVFAPFLKNLEAYVEWLGDCKIMVARFQYNKQAFGNVSKGKPGASKATDMDSQTWFDPAIEPYVCDDPERHGTCRWQLAKDLWFCAEFQIDPTATRPLSGLLTVTGNASTVFPHTRVAMEAGAVMPGTPFKHVFTTGTVTGRNYIQRKAGLKAQFHHTFASLLVEVNSDGEFWARQLIADSKGDFYDCPGGYVVKISNGSVEEGHRAEAINFGDTHLHDLPADRLHRYWVGDKKNPSVVATLNPRYEFHNDLISFRSRSHHEMKSFSKMLQKHVEGSEYVDKELQQAAEFLSLIDRPGCTVIITRANHCEHGEKWLDEVNYRHDLVNCEFFLEAQLARVKAIKSGEDWMFLEWACKRAGCPETVRFLKRDESFVICAKTHPIECGLHGDLGPNGARGSTANLANLGARLNKGHSHVPEIREGVYSAGTLSLDQKYNKGPSSWSISSILTMPNGKRQILTEKQGRLWA